MGDSLFVSTKSPIRIDDDILYLPKFFDSKKLLVQLKTVIEQAPFRQMTTPGGKKMSAQMTNAGDYGWISDSKGYRYEAVDPLTRKAWPEIPTLIKSIAREAGELFGHFEYRPDACLINRYKPNAQMSAHQDRDEKDFSQPVISLSVGASAIFKMGGNTRTEIMKKIRLNDGDVLVFGLSKRLSYHAVGRPLQNNNLLLNGDRICCTCRVAR